MTLKDFVLDTWASISYKTGLDGAPSSVLPWVAPTWLNDEARRRLTAYSILASYRENSSRFWIRDVDEDKLQQRREYGDAGLMIEQVVASLIGDEQRVLVAGADLDDASAQLTALQEYYERWFTNERFPLKIIENERHSVGLGDGVFVLGWDARRGRATCESYDPGFYFPVLPDTGSDYPLKVHLAWEFTELNARGEDQRYVRRITWELTSLEDWGLPPRRYPWNANLSDDTCRMTDATWEWDELGDRKVNDLDLAKAVFEVNAEGEEIRDLDLNIDFIPLVHVPNSVALAEHFGRALIARVLQILDDLQAADTDLNSGAAIAGFPPIGVSGAQLDTDENGRVLTYGPGTVWNTGDGTMSLIDVSDALDALLKYVEFLLHRLSTNARVPEAVLGRVDPGKINAGVILALSFGPLESLIREMRLVRDEKYPLLMKFVGRFAMLNGDIPPGELPNVQVTFGSFLPSDRKAAVEEVRTLFAAGNRVISLETAVKILVKAGFPIDDARLEVARIRAEDFQAAADMLDVTGNEDAVSDRLGIEIIGTPEPPPEPVPVPPPPT